MSIDNQRFITLNIVNTSQSPIIHKPLNLNIISETPSVKRIRWGKNSLPIFLKKAAEIHGDKYDYSQITTSHIHNSKSRIPIICRTCLYEWSPTIADHINGKYGCISCAGKLKWTLSRFIPAAIKIHGGKFDYSKVREEHFEGVYSKIPVICKFCNYEWTPSIGSHINNRYGCPSCSQNIPWTLERFLIKATKIHGDKYNYSLVTIDDIHGKDSKVQLICNSCSYEWAVSIHNHINSKHGCPSCAGVLPWTYEKLLTSARNIHGEKYDYTAITPYHVINARSKIPIKCIRCNYEWTPTISDHINSQSGCPDCGKQSPWNLRKLIMKGSQIHDSRYDYSLNRDNINGKYSVIKIKCNICYYIWESSIQNHIHGKHGCPQCANVAPWTYDRLMILAPQIHGTFYDYSQVTPDHVRNVMSTIPIVCNKCGHLWTTQIHDHINHKTGCPVCKSSKGERMVICYLQSVGITYQPQYIIPTVSDRKYDVYFEYNHHKILVEFDGEQHFIPCDYFDKNDPNNFKMRQEGDLLKTKIGLESGYKIIRIDHTQLNNVAYHIQSALNSENLLYVSNTDMYKYILDNIDSKFYLH